MKLAKPVLFVCDLQVKFRKPIWHFDKVLLTTTKLIRASNILSIPIYATTQNRARLGPTVPEIQNLIANAIEHVDKTAFSMWIPPISRHFPAGEAADIAIVGIETQICVTQTALDLLRNGHNVYVIAEGVSSTNPQEIGIALRRLRDAGAVVTTSESWIYMCMGDAKVSGFKEVMKVVKEEAPNTADALRSLTSKL